MYILKEKFGEQEFYRIINTRTGLDIGKTFDTREDAEKYLKGGK